MSVQALSIVLFEVPELKEKQSSTSSMRLLVKSLQSFERVSLARALVGALLFEARDAQDVTGAVAIRLLYVLKINFDNHLRLNLYVAPARGNNLRLKFCS